jgi:hypothetical protein
MDTATDFALDLQELNGKGGDFLDNVKILLREYMDRINREKSIGDILAFTDGSGCQFVGHHITLLKNIS